MKRPARRPISTKIEVNKDKIYRISDPVQLSEVFFPSKNAHRRRAAFLAIFFEIKNAPDQRLNTTDHIGKKYSISQSAITKARAKMNRIGLIRKREGYWIFSTIFAKTLENIVKKIVTHQVPKHTSPARITVVTRNKDFAFVIHDSTCHYPVTTVNKIELCVLLDSPHIMRILAAELRLHHLLEIWDTVAV